MWIQRIGTSVRTLAYAPDGRTLYTVEGDRVRAWDIASRRPTTSFGLITAGISYWSGLWNVGGRYLLFGSYQHLTAWDLQEGTSLQAPPFVREQCQPVGGTSTAVRFLSTDGTLVRSWDLSTGKLKTLVRKPDQFNRIGGYAVSPDERVTLVFDGYKRVVVVTDVSGASKSVKLPSKVWGTDAQFAANGMLVWIGWYGVWTSSATRLSKVSGPLSCKWPRAAFATHPTAPIFAALNENKQITLFCLLTGREIRSFDLAYGSDLRKLAFSPDGLTCAVAGSNRQFAVFDVDI